MNVRVSTWATVTAFAMLGCGTGPTEDAGSAPSTAASSGGASVSGSDAATPATPGQLANGDAGATDAGSCATATAVAEREPVSLVFMYDRSGSMAGTKWQSTKAGVETFFGGAASAGIRASLTFFTGTNCSAATYQTPSVSMRPLPETSAFAAALDGATFGQGTPTGPALEGAVAYASSLPRDGTVAVVLVTDGEPVGCGGMTSAISAATSGAASGIKTFVIGVGSSLVNLNSLAKAGGTGQAILVDTSDPSQLEASFESALDNIRTSTMTCDFLIPQSSANGSVDPNEVNLTVSRGDVSSPLEYDAGCAAAGWRYDDPKAPKKVELCPQTCTAVRNDPSSQVTVEFGCKTRGGTPR